MNTDKSEQISNEAVPLNILDACIIKLGNTLSLLFIFTVAISFYEVVMRYIFDSPTIWVHETASFIGGSLFVFGGIYAFATNSHVRVVLIYDIVSSQTRRYLNLFHHIMGLIFASLMAWAGYIMVVESWFSPFGELRLNTSGSAWNPPFPALLKGIIFITFCVLIVQFILHIIFEVNEIRKQHNV